MTDYIDLAITTEAATLYSDGVDAITSNAPAGWTPSPIEQWILIAVARIAVEIAVLAGQVPIAIFQFFGQSVLKVAALAGTPATGLVTFTLTDALGHTVDQGTVLTIGAFTFTTDSPLVVPVGQSAGIVGVTAAANGTDANALPAGAVTLVSPTFVFVTSVALNAPTAGGTDEETGTEYADRLADELPTLSPKAILIGDFEALARKNPVVGRALAIDNYDPGPPIVTNAEGHVTVAVQDAVGEPVPGPTKTAIAADLAANRVLNIVVHVIDPSYASIDVAFTATARPGFTPATVELAAEAAITAFLSPASWGHPPNGDPVEWDDEPTVIRNDLYGVLYGVPGIRHVPTLTLALHGGGLGTADVALTGPAALPRAGTINGTVT